jgi:hypothetical protein
MTYIAEWKDFCQQDLLLVLHDSVGLGLIWQRDVTRLHFDTAEPQKTKTSIELESLRSRRSWIEQQCLSEPFDFRLMRVAEDADVRSFAIQKGLSVFRELSTFVQNMTDCDAAACQFNDSLRRKYA